MEIHPHYSLDEIVENGLCTGCGLCRSVLGAEVLTFTNEEDGLERPREKRPMSGQEKATLNAICPGVNVSVPDTVDGSYDPMWGAYTRLVRGFASDPAIRFRAATGGVLTALAIHILESGKADYIMHLRADPERPMLSMVQRSFSREDVVAASGSRYSASAPLVGINQALDEGRPFAFVGKPCDATALANLARLDARVNELCRYKMVMVCGGFSELSKFGELLDRWNMEPEELTRFSYRGNGCPGPTAAETKEGRVEGVPYWELWSDESTWRSFYRCKICPDAIGLSADLAALDVWDDGNATQEDDGWNGIIARNDVGRELLEGAVASGLITLDEEWDTGELDRCQPHQVRKRQAVKARYAAMAENGLPYPRTGDPCLDGISHQPGSEAFEREKSGTLSRLARGGHLRPESRET